MSAQFTFDIAGAITMWELKDAVLTRVVDVFVKHGFSRIKPKARTEDNALTLAMQEHAVSRDFRVERRKNAAKNGREMVRVDRHEVANDYNVAYSAKIEEGRVVVDYMCPVPQWKLQESFEKFKGLVTVGELGRKMVDVVRALKGQTNLCSKGGIYFIPNLNLSHWEAFASDIESLHGLNRVHVGKVIIDDKSARMVVEAVTAEVLEEAKRIVNDIDNKELTDEQVETRIRDSAELIEKVETYSDVLGESKKQLLDVANLAKQVACKATWQQDAMIDMM